MKAQFHPKIYTRKFFLHSVVYIKIPSFVHTSVHCWEWILHLLTSYLVVCDPYTSQPEPLCFLVDYPGAPEIEMPQEYLNEVKHKAGSNVELKFNITAKPAPTIEWFKDGRELSPSAQLSFKHTFESTSVFLKETTRLNSGTYEVKVKNSLGSSCAIVRLLIQGILNFYFQFSDSSLEISNILTMMCKNVFLL